MEHRQIVFQQGDVSPVVLVLEGHVAMRRTTVEGRQLMTRIVGQGQLTGILALANRPAPADAVGLTAARLLAWSAPALHPFAADDAGLALDMLSHVLDAFETVVGSLDGLLYQDALGRVARTLFHHRQLFFADEPALTRADLPTVVGTSREMTGRVLRALEERGIVARTGRFTLRLLDPDGLESIARRAAAPTSGRARANETLRRC